MYSLCDIRRMADEMINGIEWVFRHQHYNNSNKKSVIIESGKSRTIRAISCHFKTGVII